MTDEAQHGPMITPPFGPSAPPSGPPPGWWLASDGRWYPPPQPGGPTLGYQQPWYPAAQQRTNGLAIASMVLGILWLYWIGSILALVFGYVAASQIRQSGNTQGGSGMATTGIVLGWIGVGTFVLVIVVGVARAGNF